MSQLNQFNISQARKVYCPYASERHGLRSTDVDIGDIVYQNDTDAWYLVVDTDNLSNESGYEAILTGSSSGETFSNVTVTGLTEDTLVYANSAKLLSSVTLGTSLSFSSGTLNTIQGIRTADSPTFVGATFSGVSASTLAYFNGTKALASATAAQVLGAAGLSTTSTDNAVVRFDGTTGGTQNSVLIVGDTTGALSGFTTGTGITLHGGGTITGASGVVTIAASGSNKSVVVTPTGTGQLVVGANGTGDPMVINNTAVNGASSFAFNNNSGSGQGSMGYANASYAAPFASSVFLYHAANPFKIVNSSLVVGLMITGTGGRTLVGTSTDDGSTRLQVNGTASATNFVGTFAGNTFTTGTGTLTIAAAKTLTASNTLTLAGTDSTTQTFPTTSATIARTDAAQSFTGLQTMLGSGATSGFKFGATAAATMGVSSDANTAGNLNITPPATGSVLMATGGTVTAQLSLQGTSSTGYSQFYFLDHTGASQGGFGWGNSGSASPYTSSVFINTGNSSAVKITYAGTVKAMFAATTGNLLLGGLTTDGANGVLQFPAATTSAGGITFGTDVNLYRSGAGEVTLLSATSRLLKLTCTASNASVQLNSPADFNSGFVLQENSADKILVGYNANSSSSGRVPDTFEVYSFVGSVPILQIHDSAAAGSLYINSASNVSLAGDLTVSGGDLTLTGAATINGSTTLALKSAGTSGLTVDASQAVAALKGLGFGVTSTATAAGTTTLTSTSTVTQIFTGSTTQSVTLPAANLRGAGVGVVFTIKDRSSGTVTINRAGADTIDGATSYSLLAGNSVTLISDGVSDWTVN